MLITENQLHEWVRGNSRIAQGVVVELVWRLVCASSPGPNDRRFPLGDSVEQPGVDGYLNTDFQYPPFVPPGASFWEIGTGVGAGKKATSDYRELTKATPPDIRADSTFIFVTPLSARRDWTDTWKEGAQSSWIKRRIRKGEWKDVRVIDGTKLVDWLHQFPSVEFWLARCMGQPVSDIDTPEWRWDGLKTVGEPPSLPADLFLANREGACAKLEELFSGSATQLRVETRYPEQVADLVAAFVASMEPERRIDALGRCLILSSNEAWAFATSQGAPHVLVADAALEVADPNGMRLLEKAKRSGHAVIYSSTPGGIPHPNSVRMNAAKSYQLRDALVAGGYAEERARVISEKSGANLGSLLRLLQNVSLMPEWAEGSAAADLAVAAFLGGWDENSESDRQVVEELSGKQYGEWIATIREISLSAGAPLIQHSGNWKFILRYEGWCALGPSIFDEHLERFRSAAVRVLGEDDPKFELPPDEQYAAGIHGLVLQHSPALRAGLSESLALLGCHSAVLTSCTPGRPEITAALVVRDLLGEADWLRWASVNHCVPLLAESAPGEFLDSVDAALSRDACPFDPVYEQEGDGITGANHMTGLLWGLETLAWDADFLTRVILCLGELAGRDPGGRWANRPAESMRTILLPWLPQTCASIERRKTAVAALLNEGPDVGWELLLALLPQSHSTSSYSRMPAWRETVPDTWSNGVTVGEYQEQAAAYAELAVGLAKSDLGKLAQLIDRMENLPPPVHAQLIEHLGSEQIVTMSPEDRTVLWTELVGLASKHKKFAEAEWSMPTEQVERILAVAERLAPDSPELTHRRLFGDRDSDLYDEKGDYEVQESRLDQRRQDAIQEILEAGGPEAALSFAKSVESPWRVGIALGQVAEPAADTAYLPRLLSGDDKAETQLVGGFVWGRFRSREWVWVDQVDTSKWTDDQAGEFLTYLPFFSETWTRCTSWLGSDESAYWSRVPANPYGAHEGLEHAIARLIEHERPGAALHCVYRFVRRSESLDKSLTVKALLNAVGESESAGLPGSHELQEIIESLQGDPETDPDQLFQVEWAYLPLLDDLHGGSPKFLGRKLASEPGFFCEVIRLIFRSKNEEKSREGPSEAQAKIASNAYRLLKAWNSPPGAGNDGDYDEEALTEWLGAVKAACRVSGHYEVAMQMVGHVMVHAPADPDGLWIHKAPAGALNGRDVEDMRTGFRIQLANSRGAYWSTGGRAELELAQKYREQADSVEGAGFHRLATTMRDLAGSYESDAEREASKDALGD